MHLSAHSLYNFIMPKLKSVCSKAHASKPTRDSSSSGGGGGGKRPHNNVIDLVDADESSPKKPAKRGGRERRIKTSTLKMSEKEADAIVFEMLNVSDLSSNFVDMTPYEDLFSTVMNQQSSAAATLLLGNRGSDFANSD